MPYTGRRLWGEDTSNEAERLRPNNTARKAVKERLSLWEGLAFSVIRNCMLDIEQDLMAQFAVKIMGWRNLRYEDAGDEGFRLFGEYKKGNEWHPGQVPDYGNEAMALWAAETYLKNAGLLSEYVTALMELTGCGDLSKIDEIFKLINAQPIVKVRAAVKAYDNQYSDSEAVN